MVTQFKGMLHLLHKRMADISYPVTKQEIIDQIGMEKVKTGENQYMTVSDIVQPIHQETFSCAAEFYCALLGA